MTSNQSYETLANIDYQTKTDSEFFLRISEGRYAGVDFCIRNVEVMEVVGDDEGTTIQYDYDILAMPETLVLEGEEDGKALEDVIGNVISAILQDAFTDEPVDADTEAQ